MHLGNLFSALLSWLNVRYKGGKWILRIEDLDPQRSKRQYSEMIEDDLNWLGLDWDEGGLEGTGLAGPYSQSERTGIYEEYLRRMEETGLIYPCYCTKAEITAANAPHAGEFRHLYPGTCLPERLGGTNKSQEKPGRIPSLRIHLPDNNITFHDLIYGEQSVNIAKEFGDFTVRRSDGAWAYQLAVVIDDALMGVTEVVRGSDLLQSAAVQIYLHRLLGFKEPEFMHVPLICNAEGKRLSKRDKDLSMEVLRQDFTPSGLTGYLAYLAGILPEPFPISPQSLVTLYHPSAIKRSPAILIQ